MSAVKVGLLTSCILNRPPSRGAGCGDASLRGRVHVPLHWGLSFPLCVESTHCTAPSPLLLLNIQLHAVRQNTVKTRSAAVNAEMGVSAAGVLGMGWLLLSPGPWEQHGEGEPVPHWSLQTQNLWLILQPFLPGKITISC